MSNALADDLLKDLHLTSDDYNNVREPESVREPLADSAVVIQGTTIQLLCFLAAEFPVQMLTKRYGFKFVLPSMMMLWGIACISALLEPANVKR